MKRCDKCEDESTEKITKCPEFWDDLGEDGFAHDYYCESCCKKLFSESECNGECEQKFVLEERKRNFENLYKKFKLLKEIYGNARDELIHHTSKGYAVYMSGDKTFAIGYDIDNIKYFNKMNYEQFSEIDIDYKGRNYLLIKSNGNIVAYNMRYVGYAEEFIKLFGISARTNELYSINYKTNGKLLLIEHYHLWVIIAPSISSDVIENEQDYFIVNLNKGLNFFTLDISNKLDWNKINYRKFEELIADLIMKEENIKNVTLFGGGGGDLKRDVVCDEVVTTITGTNMKKLVIECKKHNSSVDASPLVDVIKFHGLHNADKYLFVTSSLFTNTAKDVICGWNLNNKYPFEAAFWEKRDIEKRLSKHPELIIKYFGNSK